MIKPNKKISRLFITIAFLALANLASAQNSGYIKRGTYSASTETKEEKKQEDKLLYGPLPYRTLQETIGEIYIALPLTKYSYNEGYRNLFKKGDKKNVNATEGEGKKLKLISLDENEGTFIDSVGVEYNSKIFQGVFTLLAPLSDLEDSRKLFLNKSLWLNIDKYSLGTYKDWPNTKQITDARYTKVNVVDIQPSGSNDIPVIIIFKNNDGEIGSIAANMSGTNSNVQVPLLFKEKFFTENPQTKYKLSDKIWAAVKAGRTEIGMPMDAVQLIEGRPTKRNKSVIGNIRKEQWVYGETAIQSYFYFENGKLTAISR